MTNMPKKIAIFGSTGSVGLQALEVVRANPGAYRISILSANSSVDLLARQAKEFRPEAVVIGDGNHYRELKKSLSGNEIPVYEGNGPITDLLRQMQVEVVLNAIVGYAGFEPTLRALMAVKTIALANKESLVVGGELVTKTAAEQGARILPVDSEHSAIFQCLQGEDPKDVQKVYLTASGGPFVDYTRQQLEKVTVRDALNHPTWNMGDKITIDSASLMNKGLEVIEAKWLFNLAPEQLEVVVHPQSVIHSMVEFVDSSIKAQMSLPDMRLPIIYALSYPGRMQSRVPGIDFRSLPDLTFRPPDTENFRNLALAFEALGSGGNAPCVLNAANEVAVSAFLSGRIGFLAIPEVVEQCLAKVSYIRNPDFEGYVKTDAETRIKAREAAKDWEK